MPTVIRLLLAAAFAAVLTSASSAPSSSLSSSSVASAALAIVPEQRQQRSSADIVRVDEDFGCKSVFVPTREWAPIRDGECVPPGLHIRFNFATGGREARLPDDDDDDHSDGPNTLHLAAPSKDDNNDDNGPDDPLLDPAVTPLAALKPHLEFLTEELAALDEGVAFMHSPKLVSRLIALFAHADPHVRILAARVFAAVLANNDAAQALAASAKTRGLLTLVRAFEMETVAAPQKSFLVAITAATRGSPTALHAFAEMDGFGALKRVYDACGDALQRKIRSLISDLFDPEMVADSAPVNSLDLKSLADSGFCSIEITQLDRALLKTCSQYTSNEL
ncbi:hypothetical protein HDU83_007425 [Entophlyctis luteolus]|nr:hypothetical protein HDU82_000914 [Entophlyctis luteolus]KAJ3339918.1 hypothetical protein HDU83_007425 [Entophlyctis luteolus]KAJ3378216.1 hypothetical protein HDU84_007828 [Entophlyctis sp. JEL0112]